MWFGGGEPDDALGALPYDAYSWKSSPAGERRPGTHPAFSERVPRRRDHRPRTLVNSDKPHVSISKADIVTGEELPGATLQVTDAEGNVVDEWMSGKSRTRSCSTRPYTLREEIAPEGYLVANSVDFEVVSGQVSQKVTWRTTSPKVDAERVDAETGAPLSGAAM